MPTYSSHTAKESLRESLLLRTRKISSKKQSSSIIGPICGGILSGFLVIFRAVSFSSVYFNGPILSPHIAVCLQSLLISGIVAQLCYMNHSVKGCISCPSSTATPFQAALITCIISNMGEAPTTTLAVQSALLSFMLSSILFGLSLLFVVMVCKREYLETFKTAFPQPVIYGFFVAVGLAMIESSLKVVVGEDILQACWTNRIAFAQCLTSIGFGLLNRFGSRYLRHYLALPGLLLTEIAVVYVCLAACGMSVEEAREEGWLFDSVAIGPVLNLPSNYMAHPLAEVWSLVTAKVWSILASMIVVLWVDLAAGTVVPIESCTNEGELNMRSELVRAGVTNLACGASGGGVCYMSLSPTRLNEDAGGGASRLSLVFSMLTSAVWLVCGGTVLEFIPKPWAAGMLLHLAFGYILEGAWDPRQVLTRSEFVVILLITIVYIVKGMVTSILVGCILCCMYFTARYATSPVVMIPTDVRSTQARTRENSAAVERYYRDRTIIVVRTVCSQLFFGTSASIKNAVKKISMPNTRVLVFDLGSVEEVDISALVALGKIPSSIGRNVELIICNVNFDVDVQLKRSRTARLIPEQIRIFREGDLAMQWAEDSCLLAEGISLKAEKMEGKISKGKLIGKIFGDVRIAKSWRKLFITIKASCGESIYQEGALAKGMYIVARGRLSLYDGCRRIHTAERGDKGPDISIARRVGPYGILSSREFCGARSSRSQVVQAGDILCEKAAYVACVHCKSLVADEDDTELLLLTRERVLRLEHAFPEVAMKLHRALAMKASGVVDGNWEKSGMRDRINSVNSDRADEEVDLVARLHGYGGGNALLLVPSGKDKLRAKVANGGIPPVSI